MLFEHENPYVSPREANTGELRQRPWRPGVRSRLLAKGLLYRRVALEAPIEATLEFNGRSLHDVIRVDNRVVASHFSWWRITPRFRFQLAVTGGAVPVEVDLRLGHFLRMKGFRIKIAGEVVYQEGQV